jgi:hypothetical protein
MLQDKTHSLRHVYLLALHDQTIIIAATRPLKLIQSSVHRTDITHTVTWITRFLLLAITIIEAMKASRPEGHIRFKEVVFHRLLCCFLDLLGGLLGGFGRHGGGVDVGRVNGR